MTQTDLLLAAQAVASGAMCGIIWFVQLVHYPLFCAIPAGHSVDYARENQRRTPLVVVPFMLVEGATALFIALSPPAGIGRVATLIGVSLVALVWLSTAAVQMPQHARLGRGGDAAAAVAALVRGNWLRTLLWTARALLAAWMLRTAG
jgi:hypothetical protein